MAIPEIVQRTPRHGLWAGVSHKLDSVVSEAFSSPTDPVILTCLFLKIRDFDPACGGDGKNCQSDRLCPSGFGKWLPLVGLWWF